MKKSKLTLRCLCEAAIMIALAQLLGYIKFYELPQGGAITLSMLPIFLFCSRWGFGPGMLVRLNQQRHIEYILSVPSRERSQQLQALGSRVDVDRCFRPAGGDIAFIAGGETSQGEFISYGFGQFHFLAVMVHQSVFQRIEAKITGNGQCHRQFGRSNKGVCVRIAVRTFGKVTVEGGDDRVLPRRVVRMTFPLTDARTAGICHDHGADLHEVIHHSVSFGSSADLLGTRIDNQRGSHTQILFLHLPCKGCGTAEILVRGVGTRTDQSDFHLTRIAVQ